MGFLKKLRKRDDRFARVACHDELKESYPLEGIANFLMEMGVKV